MKHSFVATIFLGIATSVFFYFSNSYRNQPKIVFCDVGQGDAIYFRLPGREDVLLDSGPNQKVLACLNKYMPYFDRSLEVVFITHAQKDHAAGLKYVADNFKIKQLFTTSFSQQQQTQFWRQLTAQLKQEKLTFQYLERGDKLILNSAVFTVLWPPNNYLKLSQLKNSVNNTSLGILALVKDKQILLLSDLDASIAEKAIDKLKLSIAVLKINHHGSKYATSRKFLQLANPTLSVISAGRNNFYGHPAQQVLDLLQSLDIPVRRTDLEGDVMIPL